MGVANPRTYGCILADEMGLGKTLQAIAIIWSLLKTGPNGVPSVKKAVIVCPATLIGNWKAEFKVPANSTKSPKEIPYHKTYFIHYVSLSRNG